MLVTHVEPFVFSKKLTTRLFIEEKYKKFCMIRETRKNNYFIGPDQSWHVCNFRKDGLCEIQIWLSRNGYFTLFKNT